MDIQEEILNTIEMIVAKTIKKSNISLDIPSVVQDIDNEHHINTPYRVQMNGTYYWLKAGTNLTLKVGTPVWIHVPNGNYRQSFILAYR